MTMDMDLFGNRGAFAITPRVPTPSGSSRFVAVGLSGPRGRPRAKAAGGRREHLRYAGPPRPPPPVGSAAKGRRLPLF